MSVFDSQQGNQDQQTTRIHQARQNKLKEIQILYREQIKQIYNESRIKIQKQQQPNKKPQSDVKNHNKGNAKTNKPGTERKVNNAQSLSTLNFTDSKSGRDKYPLHIDELSRPSTFLKAESTKTFEKLRRENQTKELKIRQLTNKIQFLMNKLKRYMKPEQFQDEMQKLREFSDDKMERLQNLFKIKNEQIFFKIKLQIIGLLQQFGIAKQQLVEVQEVINESTLIAFMTNKLKVRLKDFRYKEQKTHLSIQQDKILGQKQEQRIHYLIETNELHKLSESKLKNKIQDLKVQLNNFLQLLKEKQKENEQRQSQVFRLKKQLQQSNTNNQKLQIAIKDSNFQKLDEQKTQQVKIIDMKSLLNKYYVQKDKLLSELEQKDGQIQEFRIKLKFLEQQNDRLNRELVRWKERYDWLQKEKETKYKEILQVYNNLVTIFEKYKEQHNQGIIIFHKTQTNQALKRVEDYQMAYEQTITRLEDEKNLFSRAQEQNQEKLQRQQNKWRLKIKELQQLNQKELEEINNYNQIRQTELKEQYDKKSVLQIEEMEARMKAFLAQRDKENIEEFIKLEMQNDQLRREIQNLNKVLSVKQSLINVISNKKFIHD